MKPWYKPKQENKYTNFKIHKFTNANLGQDDFYKKIFWLSFSFIDMGIAAQWNLGVVGLKIQIQARVKQIDPSFLARALIRNKNLPQMGPILSLGQTL